MRIHVFGVLTFTLGWLIAPTSTGHAANGAEPTATVDTTPVLKIGEVTVSRYQLQKYHGRFVEGFRQREGRAPTAAEHTSWIDLFVAKQAVIAHATALGYAERPEVERLVSRMERHMLTQTAGPFYRELKAAIRLDDDTLRSWFEHSSWQVDWLAVKFPTEAAARSALGPDFSTERPEEQARRIRVLRERDGVEADDGPRLWPFTPFVEIADLVSSAPTGGWTTHTLEDAGYYLFKVRDRTEHPKGDFNARREEFGRFARHVADQAVQRRRRGTLLNAAGFSFDADVGRKMADALAALPAASPEIPAGLSTFADQTLCRYRIGAEAFAITAEEFRATFNQWFIRRIPRDVGALRRAAEDMVVEELDFREARARGIDRTAQFVEDRRGFAGFQVLDLFEREVLQPKLKIDAAAVERSYGERAAEFVEITRIRGRLAEFATPDAAGAWMGQMNPVASRPPSSAPQRETELVVERNKPILGLEAFHSMLFASEVGAPLGPWQRGNAWVVFVKSEDLERSLIPLAAVAPRIRADLERAALDAELLRLAQELAPRLKIENAIDHAEFGGQERPWPAALPR